MRSLGIYQWLLLVLLWQRCHWWHWKSQLLQSFICCQADIQLTDWVYSGKRLIPQPTLLNLQLSSDRIFYDHHSLHLSPSGPVYWEPAEFSSQQTVGCSCGLLACVCQHANEAVSGSIKLEIHLFVKHLLLNNKKIWLERIQLK